MPAGVITIPVVPGMDSFGALLKSGLGAALATAGVAASFGEVLKVGNEFTSSLNTLQGVTSATGAQMADVSAKARALGSDMSLPSASASDAAAAMTELAKGGFTVAQAMDAAKGSLQLAAAGQIDAARAAEIQSQTIAAFSLKATDATHVADVLTNVSIGAQGSINDFALAFKAGSATANGFGVSLEDTATTLGLFAKAGITGSDAGTLLKSTLLALTDQGNPAQGAIKQLGLSVYDASGQFVGMRSLTEQLTEAQKRMTPEAFQAASAVLFGSDAIRASVILANDGVPAFDAMGDSIRKNGTATDFANTQMQGLPGAIKRVQNAAEDAALTLYDLVDGPLEKLGNLAASGLTAATAGISDAIKNVGDSGISASPAMKGFVDALDTLKEIGGNVVDVVKPLGVGIYDVVKNLGTSGGIISTVGSAFDGFLHIVSGAVAILEPIASAIGGIATFFSNLPGPVQTATVALIAFRFIMPSVTAAISTAGTAMSRFAIIATGQVVGALAAITTAYTTAAGAASRFGAVGSVVAGSAGVMRAGLSSLASLAGGPLVLGLVAATYAFSAMSAGADRIADSGKTFRTLTDDIKKGSEALRDSLNKSNGVVTDDVIGTLTTKLDTYRTAQEKLASDTPGTWGLISSGVSGAWDLIDGSMDGTAIKSAETAQRLGEDGKKVADQFAATGKSSKELAQIISGSTNEFNKFVTAQGQAGNVELANHLRDQRAEFLKSQDAATQAGEAYDKIRDSAVTAADGVDKLTDSLAKARGDLRTTEEAQKSATLALDSFKSSAEGAGAATVDAAGKIDLSVTAGVRLDDAVQKVGRAYDEAGAAAATSATQQKLSAEDTAAAVAAAQSKVRSDFIATAVQTGITQQAAEALAAKYLDLPPEIKTTASFDPAPANAQIEAYRNTIAGATIPLLIVPQLSTEQAPRTSLPGVPDSLLPHNATGGKLPSTGPGTGTTDGIMAITGAGRPVAMVDGGEWIVNSESSEKYDREIAMMNAGTFPKLPGFADGGRIAVDRAAAFLSSQSGKPYVYGATGGQGFDCSGFISAGYAALRNLDTATRWFTTESDFGALGFQSGLGPKQFLNIGVHNGGGGKLSHMAGTLNGVPFEAGGNGVRYGAGATGAEDGQFEHKYSLPGALFVPADEGTGTAKKKSDNTSSGDSSKDSLANDVTTLATTPSSSTSTVSSASSVTDLLGNVAKAFVVGQLDDAFGAIGLSGGPQGAIGAAITQGTNYAQNFKPVKPSFSPEELAKQAPVTPGTSGWFEEMLKTFKIPAVIRDQGGPLKHGMAALNLSGETEWVSTATQRANDLAAIRNNNNSGGGSMDLSARSLDALTSALSGSTRAPVTVNTGARPQEVISAIRMEQRMASASFRGDRR